MMPVLVRAVLLPRSGRVFVHRWLEPFEDLGVPLDSDGPRSGILLNEVDPSRVAVEAE